jgi:hypothetical protein
MNIPRNTTLLSDLPTIDDIDNNAQSNIIYKKYIRGNYTPPANSGMSAGQPLYPNNIPPPPQVYQPPPPNITSLYENTGNCVDVNSHVLNCPLCSKLYRSSSDRMFYMFIIIVLLIFCVILARKLWNL